MVQRPAVEDIKRATGQEHHFLYMMRDYVNDKVPVTKKACCRLCLTQKPGWKPQTLAGEIDRVLSMEGVGRRLDVM